MKQLSRAVRGAPWAFSFSLPEGAHAGSAGGRQREDCEVRAPALLSASDLEGDEVRNRNGQKLGHIEEILLDVPAGRIAFAVLACSSGERSGDRFCAVPWRAFTYDSDNKCFILEVSRERFQQAPSLEKQDLPQLAESRRIDELHAYYGTQPY